MFENDHMDEFDLQMRSILEGGQEEVPAEIWDGVAAGLDKAARAKAISLWLRRAGLGVAAAAAAVAGFIFIDTESNTDLVPAISGDLVEMIAVVEDTEIPAEGPEDNIISTTGISMAAKQICMSPEPASSVQVAAKDVSEQKTSQVKAHPGQQTAKADAR